MQLNFLQTYKTKENVQLNKETMGLTFENSQNTIVLTTIHKTHNKKIKGRNKNHLHRLIDIKNILAQVICPNTTS